DRRDRLWREQPERHHDLHEVAEQHGEAMEQLGRAMEIPAQRVGQRLGLVVVVQAGEVAPAAVVAELDETGAELYAEQNPAQEQDWNERRSHRRGTEEDG